MQDETRKTPESIKNHKYSWLFEEEWQQIHNRMEGNSFTFFIGMNGSGKSYASLKRMEILGVNENDEYGTLFDPDHLENHIFFDKQNMINKIAELEKLSLDERRGYQIMLDEAQMSVNAKEWNNKEVLNFSKDMTTIRSSRLNITLNMPTHRMITTDLRQLGTYQCEMYPPQRIDRSKKIAYSKLHFLTLRPHEGEIWRQRPLIKKLITNPITHLPTMKKARLNEIAWKLPSAKIKNRYEDLKSAFREKTANEKAENKLEPTEKRSMFKSIIDEVSENLDAFRDPKKGFSWVKIAKEYSCGVTTAQRVVKFIKAEQELI